MSTRGDSRYRSTGTVLSSVAAATPSRGPLTRGAVCRRRPGAGRLMRGEPGVAGIRRRCGRGFRYPGPRGDPCVTRDAGADQAPRDPASRAKNASLITPEPAGIIVADLAGGLGL